MKYYFAILALTAAASKAVSAAPAEAPEFNFLTVRRPSNINDMKCVDLKRSKDMPEIGDLYVVRPCIELSPENLAKTGRDKRIRFRMDDVGLRTASGEYAAAWGIYDGKTSWMSNRQDASDQEKSFTLRDVGSDGYGYIFTNESTGVDGCLSWQEETNLMVFNNTGRNILFTKPEESCAQFRILPV